MNTNPIIENNELINEEEIDDLSTSSESLPTGNNENAHNFKEMGKILKEYKNKIKTLEKEIETLKVPIPKQETSTENIDNPAIQLIQQELNILREERLENKFLNFSTQFKQEYCLSDQQYAKLFDILEDSLPSNVDINKEVLSLLEKSPSILKGTLLSLDYNFFSKTNERKNNQKIQKPIIRGNQNIGTNLPQLTQTPKPLTNPAFTSNPPAPWLKK